ncbi:MAG TPA: hypothetical protein VKA10_10970, partial [Prolixibacteraceae bacterium]|nr:hypothetical protein [Prolixibacteraceae bacterium]
WKSPNFLYVNAINPRLKVLMRNFKLSDDISFRFSDTNWQEYPLTADKFISWIEQLNAKEEIVNLFLSYESFGERQKKESGIFDFLEHFARKVAASKNLDFATPKEVLAQIQPVSVVSVPNPVSWADEERDLTAWLGNKMQKEAFEKLYNLADRMENCTDEKLIKDWNYLQASDHFYYMATKYYSGGEGQSYNNPFDSPYEAFINYMNILSDFANRLNTLKSENENELEIAALRRIIAEQNKKLEKLEINLQRFQKSKKEKSTSRKK